MTTSDLPEETSAAKRSSSTDDGVRTLATYPVDGPDRTRRNVPSYYAKRGHSVADAAKSLGLRVLGRRETGDVVAEIHEQGMSGSYLCVRIDADAVTGPGPGHGPDSGRMPG